MAIARLSASIYHHTPINLSVARHFPPLKDALGYEEMSALEFHKTMTCMLGNEHLKVAIQFMRSELNADDFMSFDQTINYTQEERQLSVPIFYMIGKTDSLTPRKVTLHNLFNIKSKEKWVAEFDQGHTGIVLHPPTAAKIAELTDGWISGAMRHPAKSLNTHAVAGIL
ncbi:MAG: pimeloyl-ACP methyl ester carboxylesterase [Candidatus Marinamargulisbacteria bacterium]